LLAFSAVFSEDKVSVRKHFLSKTPPKRLKKARVEPRFKIPKKIAPWTSEAEPSRESIPQVSRLSLPPFSIDQVINELDARFDRILLEAGPSLIEIDHSKDGENLAHHLSTPPVRLRDGEETDQFGTLFCRYNGRQRFALKIRKTRLLLFDKIYQRPLFSGYLNLSKRSRPRFKFPESGAYLTLCLNPSRFLNYQDGRRLMFRKLEGLRNWTPTLYADARNPRDEEEFQFDGNDNWIHSPIENRIGGKWTMPLFRKYFEAVLDTIFADIDRAASVVDAEAETSHGNLTFNLKNVEVYWEFSDLNPVSTINRLFRDIGIISDEQKSRRFKESAEGVEEQLIVHSIKLAAGVWLHVYAKTNARIRFEIRYNLKESAKATKGQHTCTKREDVANMLEGIRRDAANRLQEFFSMLKEEGVPSRYPVAPTAFLSRIIAYVGNYDRSMAIIQQLVHHQGIPVTDNSPFQKEIRALVRQGILYHQNRVYRVTRDYREAIRRLREVDLIPSIPGRVRRQPAA